MQLRDLAAQLNCRVEGDGTLEIVRVANLEEAGPGDVTFVANAKYQARLERTRAAAVILGVHDTITHPVPAHCTVLWADNPYLAFAQALRLLTPVSSAAPGIDDHALVAGDVSLGADVSIGPFVVIGRGTTVGARTIIEAHATIGAGVRIGDDCVIRAQVSICDGVEIGQRVIVQNGAVLGSEGFGFVRLEDGSHYKIPQRARLIVEDDVEIGANTTIDRPAVGETRIGAGTKIDNLVQVAHGVSIGRRVLLAAQVGLAGSTIVEDDAVLAGQVGVAGHLTIGKGAVLAAQSGVTGSVDPGAFLTGYPAIDNRTWRKSSVVFKQLPEMKKRIGELERKIAELEEKLAAWQTPSDR